MHALLLLASALVPAWLLLWYFWSRDAHPEPRGVVLRTFLWGAFICLPVVPVASGLEALGAGAAGTWSRALVQAFLGAAVPEELFKFLVLRLWVWRQEAFDEPMDGLVYGATASLGFAALENLLYVGSGGLHVAALRAFTAVPGHALTGAILGAYVGQARFGPPEARTRTLAAGLLVAIALHGAYDAVLMSGTGWAALALLVLWVDLRWTRRLVARLRGAQEAGGAVAAAALAPADGPALPQVERRARPRRSAWAVAKLLAGGLGATFFSLLALGVGLAWGEAAPGEGPGGWAATLAACALPALGCVQLFRSGLRGPFSGARGVGAAGEPLGG